MSRWARSWSLFKCSWNILMEDPRLMVFPALSFVSILFAMFLIFGGSVLAMADSMFDPHDASPKLMFYVVCLIGAYVATALAIYFNVALVTCAAHRLRGKKTGIIDGLSSAAYCLPQILTWAAIAVAVGYLIRAFEERLPLGLGRIVVRVFLQASWGVATFFIIPEIAFGNGTAVDALKASVRTVRHRWGETTLGTAGIGSIAFLTTVIPGGLLIMGAAAAESALAFVLAGLWILGSVVTFSTVKQVYLAALYDYATTGREPVGFLPEDMNGAFR